MAISKTSMKRGLRALALASASMLALPAYAKDDKVTVIAPTAPITGGVVRPLYGTISPFYGNISAFYGTISPFYGNISAFYGNISAFSGQVDPFWGNISAFQGGVGAASGSVGPAYGNISAFYGNISAFTGDIGAQWGNISAFWGNISAFNGTNAADYATLGGKLSGMIASSESFWGPAVKARTGKSFTDGFAAPLLAKYGVNLNDPTSLSKLDPVARTKFIFAWYDGLMEFAGTDHVDHWMKEANWTPSLTQIQGAGSSTVIGLLDFTVKNAADVQDNITTSGGVSTFSNGHGAAVASLMVAAHDGTGVMGIAPRASVVAYNPFDATGTAGWTDIKNGVIMLGNNDASIINASLGVPGYTLHPDWNGVLSDSKVRDATKTATFVIAAGNSGTTQTANIAWNKDNAQVLVVGSVDPTLTISSFSNRPGNACLLDGKDCKGDYLMNHFIVAPGEMILVSDDAGGFTRMSGTSFAAPLVSGAIALLHDRWPWLADHPKDTVTIITKSATDLGAPGVDPVYGVGLLNVTASQSPLSYDALQWWSPNSGVTVKSIFDLKQTQVSTLRDPKQQATWEANGVYVYGYEQLSETFRDFAIPLSSKLVGQSVLGATGQMEQLQTYLTSSFKSWAATPVTTAPPSGDGKKGKFAFIDFRSDASAPLAKVGGLSFSFAAAPRAAEPGWRTDGAQALVTRVSAVTEDGGAGFRFGMGEGASALGGVTGLNLRSDYDPMHGGANPLLGFASGGAYGGVNFKLARSLRFDAGVTTRDSRRALDDLSGRDRLAAIAVGDYRAQASHAGLTWRASERIQLTGGYTHLNENDGLLGVQSTDRADLGRGSQTDGVDAGADIALGDGLTFSAAASLGRTRQQAAGTQNLTSAGLTSSAFQVALSKQNLFGRGDRLRVSFAQPLHTESGQLRYSGVQVIDRSTGELGVVTQSFDATQNVRPLVAELLYGRAVMDGAGELGLFTRAETRGVGPDGQSTPVIMTGARFRMSY